MTSVGRYHIQKKYKLKNGVKVDCTSDWKIEGTTNGYCLTYRPKPDTSHHRPDLAISFAQNISDNTFGWYSGLTGFSISFGPVENRVYRHDHNIMVNGYLTQTIIFQRVRMLYLNTPYTKCETSNETHIYEQDYCVLVQYVRESCSQVSPKLLLVMRPIFRTAVHDG